MIPGNDRLIIVDGMAHSGTTILAFVLRQHPDVSLFSNGKLAWLLENTLLPDENSTKLQELLDGDSQKHVLLKRPWSFARNPTYLLREMPEAKFIHCVREFEGISRSWSAPNSNVARELREAGLQWQHKFYAEQLKLAEEFARRATFVIEARHENFVREPQEVMREITNWAGLMPFDFDVSEVSSSFRKDIKARLFREFGEFQID